MAWHFGDITPRPSKPVQVQSIGADGFTPAQRYALRMAELECARAFVVPIYPWGPDAMHDREGNYRPIPKF